MRMDTNPDWDSPVDHERCIIREELPQTVADKLRQLGFTVTETEWIEGEEDE